MRFTLKAWSTKVAHKKLKRHWKSKNLRIAHGASKQDLQTFEARYGVVLPKDFRDYFLSVDGMLQIANHECDPDGFGFYPLVRVKNVVEEYAELSKMTPSNASNPQTYFVFVDYLQWSWAYAIRLSNDVSQLNEVIHVGTIRPKVIANSFSEFVDMYLKDARELYPD